MRLECTGRALAYIFHLPENSKRWETPVALCKMARLLIPIMSYKTAEYGTCQSLEKFPSSKHFAKTHQKNFPV